MDLDVGREVKRLREGRGWSQARLAVEAQMSVSGVSMIENGQRNLTTTTLAKLATALGVEVADLFPKAETPLPFEEELKQRRHPFVEAWTSYMLQRAQEWEKALPKSALGRITFPELPEELVEEMSAKPQLASEVLRRNELVQSEATALLWTAYTAMADTVLMDTGVHIGAREIIGGSPDPETARRLGKDYHKRLEERTDLTEFREALVQMNEAAERWDMAERAARPPTPLQKACSEQLKRAGEKAKWATDERRKVVALFEKRRSA